MNSTVMLFNQIILFCIVIYAIILFQIYLKKENQNNQRIFTYLIFVSLAFALFEGLWILIDYDYLYSNRVLSYIINILYFICTGLMPMLWFSYTQAEEESKLFKERKFRILAMIPFFILVILSVTTFKTGLLFQIDQYNEYHRGILYPYQLVCSYGYLLSASFVSLKRAFCNENYAKRDLYFTIALFPIYPVIFGSLQLVFPFMPLLHMGIALTIIQFYIMSLNNRISTDGLTQMNNRNAFIKYLDRLFHDQKLREHLCVMIMDIDYFKSVNDRYGHLEGDRAIRYVSQVLKDLASKYDCFIARYAGDEFVLVYECYDEEMIHTISKEIDKALLDVKKRYDLKYDLSLSKGYIYYSEDITSIHQMIHLADKELYQAKQNRKTHPSSWN